MAKTVQIRNVSEKLHRTLKARATQAGTSHASWLVSSERDRMRRI